MRRFLSQVLGVDTGSTQLFSDFEDDGEMWAGTGPRQHRTEVSFAEPYRAPPVVHVALAMFDMDHATNSRADIAAENVTEQGFEIVFRTWGDTRVARVRADWVAMGELESDEDWQLY